jgi:hypothetical protein
MCYNNIINTKNRRKSFLLPNRKKEFLIRNSPIKSTPNFTDKLEQQLNHGDKNV